MYLEHSSLPIPSLHPSANFISLPLLYPPVFILYSSSPSPLPPSLLLCFNNPLSLISAAHICRCAWQHP